ncbi:MAG: alpha/beta fold hydrolase [Gemmatimonadetes bacterium]|nr:alpha/beta fold hydrolase [Gemmatimonadota bacterium]MXV96237.1 alpha/beta fold hydrolase [Gemmatimonadota bacterium]MYB06412.1 alpha/beta fold hydrolase [Gemmatimonadota bacterium]MYE17520.1 alpha/beta fold hydrolase [Gemmatimonadota bacterium]MYG24348.1 alpha/beta fold hydrolase [Gemmatimonadota bacterium]
MRLLSLCVTLAISPLGAPLVAQEAAPTDFEGNWLGTMNAGGAQLRMRIDLTVEDGALAARVFSVDQGNAEIPVESATVAGSTLSLTMPMIGGSYEGTLSDDGQTIDGTFQQMGAELPLVLERMEGDEPDAGRPQDPVEPYPYVAEDVRYPNPDGGHELAGTFTRPSDGGPFPAVILITGSGPQNRDEALLGHRPFLVLSDHLTRRGIAVLRFDDRGVGESTGDHAAATSSDFASDALAGVAYLKTRDDVDPAAIGLAGHSEGGLIAPIAATRSDDVSYIVLMAGTGVNGERILYAQGALINRAAGATEEQIERNQELQRAMFDILKSEPDPERAAAVLTETVRTAFEAMPDAQRAQAGITDDESLDQVVNMQVTQFNTPWFRYFLTYEPATVIEQVTVPVLAINGEKDLQVPYEENLREIEAALQRGGNTNYEIHALPDLNHLFQHSETGSPSEYATIEETWSVDVMELIADWILRTTGR